jgi:hypothetical protein
MDMVVVVVTVPRSTLHFTGITGWVWLVMKTKKRGHLFLPTSQLLYAPEQSGVVIPIHQQITVQIPDVDQNFGEFTLRESECFLKEDRVKLLRVIDGPHFPGALSWKVEQHLQEHTWIQS